MIRRLIWTPLVLLSAWLSACGSDFDSAGPDLRPYCGNGSIEEGETCDSNNLAGNDCTTIGLGFTSGVLACNSACDGWDDAACVQGQGTLAGEVSVSATLSCDPVNGAADCRGAVWILVLEEDPATNLAQTPVVYTMLPDADLGGGNVIEYSVAAPEGSWYVTGFLDDDGNASTIAPGPDPGDPVSFPAALVAIGHEATIDQDVVLTITMP